MGVAAEINDSNKPRAQKEAELTALFAQHGITLTFVGAQDPE